jgi:hypothetical protein
MELLTIDGEKNGIGRLRAPPVDRHSAFSFTRVKWTFAA